MVLGCIAAYSWVPLGFQTLGNRDGIAPRPIEGGGKADHAGNRGRPSYLEFSPTAGCKFFPAADVARVYIDRLTLLAVQK